MYEWILQRHERNDARVYLEHVFTNAMLGRVQKIKNDKFAVYVISAEHFEQLEKILPSKDINYTY